MFQTTNQICKVCKVESCRIPLTSSEFCIILPTLSSASWQNGLLVYQTIKGFCCATLSSNWVIPAIFERNITHTQIMNQHGQGSKSRQQKETSCLVRIRLLHRMQQPANLKMSKDLYIPPPHAPHCIDGTPSYEEQERACFISHNCFAKTCCSHALYVQTAKMSSRLCIWIHHHVVFFWW